jgi:hypoxanthine phosphoribosyltransferase
VGVARAGLFPATAIACSLRLDLFPARLTRRQNDLVVYEQPVWKVDVSPDVRGKTIAVIDEIADSGVTVAMVARRTLEKGAVRVLTACLVSHSWADPKPDYCAMVSDALVIFPWGRQVFTDGHWQIHPELASALRMQGINGEF